MGQFVTFCLMYILLVLLTWHIVSLKLFLWDILIAVYCTGLLDILSAETLYLGRFVLENLIWAHFVHRYSNMQCVWDIIWHVI